VVASDAVAVDVVKRMKRIAIGLVRLYQRVFSPAFPATCRFTPSCSNYALGAYNRFGFFGGSWRTVRRLCRCHPWNPGGHDPVEPA